jgi:hypothetical protein
VTARWPRSRRAVGPVALALAITAALAAAPSARAATVTYSGQTSPQDFTDNGVDDPVPMSFGFDFDGTSINNVDMSTSVRCPDGSYGNVGTHPGFEAGEPFPVTNGHFDATLGDPNEGDGLTWHLVGTIASGKASGTVEVQKHQYSGVTPSGPICTSSFTWTASARKPSDGPDPDLPAPNPPEVRVTPRNPTSGRPAASLLVLALRSPVPRFYWGTARVRCLNGATNLVFTVRRKHKLVSRRRLGCRRKISLASSAVRPHRTYAISVRAIRVRNGRVIARGETYRLRMRMPGNEANWVPVPDLTLP